MALTLSDQSQASISLIIGYVQGLQVDLSHHEYIICKKGIFQLLELRLGPE